jgi:hypothetical protein
MRSIQSLASLAAGTTLASKVVGPSAVGPLSGPVIFQVAGFGAEDEVLGAMPAIACIGARKRRTQYSGGDVEPAACAAGGASALGAGDVGGCGEGVPSIAAPNQSASGAPASAAKNEDVEREPVISGPPLMPLSVSPRSDA